MPGVIVATDGSAIDDVNWATAEKHLAHNSTLPSRESTRLVVFCSPASGLTASNRSIEPANIRRIIWINCKFEEEEREEEKKGKRRSWFCGRVWQKLSLVASFSLKAHCCIKTIGFPFPFVFGYINSTFFLTNSLDTDLSMRLIISASGCRFRCTGDKKEIKCIEPVRWPTDKLIISSLTLSRHLLPWLGIGCKREKVSNCLWL